MPSLAQITIAGHVGGDATLKYTQNSDAICEFSVAVNNRDDSTTWYRITVWRKYGELMAGIVKKGATVVVLGKFQPRPYTAKDGTERYSFDITADSVIIAGNKTDDDEPNIEELQFPSQSEIDEIPF